MRLNKLAQSFPVALAMQVNQMPARVVVDSKSQFSDDTKAAVHHTHIAASDGASVVLAADSTEGTADLFERTIPLPAESWDELAEQYDNLALKEALGTITKAELKELDQLQKTRRRLDSPTTGEEILQRHRREKLDRELLRVLRRYVRLQPISTNRP